MAPGSDDARTGVVAAPGRAASDAVLSGGSQLYCEHHALLSRATSESAQARAHSYQRQVRLLMFVIALILVLSCLYDFGLQTNGFRVIQGNEVYRAQCGSFLSTAVVLGARGLCFDEMCVGALALRRYSNYSINNSHIKPFIREKRKAKGNLY